MVTGVARLVLFLRFKLITCILTPPDPGTIVFADPLHPLWRTVFDESTPNPFRVRDVFKTGGKKTMTRSDDKTREEKLEKKKNKR